MTPKERKLDLYFALKTHHADAHCELTHETAFQLLCAVVMSAQTTDVAVNKVTPKLFAVFPDARALAKAQQSDVEPLINSIGMYRQKAKNIIALSKILLARFEGEVPSTMDDLLELPGVGRKTANVVLGVVFNRAEGVVVDTHVGRISQRLGWTKESSPEKIEAALMKLLPKEEWSHASHVLIFHGRRICGAVRPQCDVCPVAKSCKSAGNAVLVGRKK
ncbi:MAG: endonuclease III [Polyangiaceae bacterium]|nr:endonuclease III [Polyangiaceae bacterium]